MDVENEIRRESVSDDLLDQADKADASFIWENQDLAIIERKNKRRRGRKRRRGKGRKGRREEAKSDNGSDELSTSVPSSSTGLFNEQVTKVKVKMMGAISHFLNQTYAWVSVALFRKARLFSFLFIVCSTAMHKGYDGSAVF